MYKMFVLFLLAERVPLERRGTKLSRKALLSSVFDLGGGRERRKILGWGLIELWSCVFLWRIYTYER